MHTGYFIFSPNPILKHKRKWHNSRWALRPQTKPFWIVTWDCLSLMIKWWQLISGSMVLANTSEPRLRQSTSPLNVPKVHKHFFSIILTLALSPDWESIGLDPLLLLLLWMVSCEYVTRIPSLLFRDFRSLPIYVIFFSNPILRIAHLELRWQFDLSGWRQQLGRLFVPGGHLSGSVQLGK